MSSNASLALALAHTLHASRRYSSLCTFLPTWPLAVPYAIAITTGHAYCGCVGNELRREYTTMGHVVELAVGACRLGGPYGVIVSSAQALSRPYRGPI